MNQVWQDTWSTNEGNRDRRNATADSRRRQPPDYSIGDKVLVDLHTHSSMTKGTTAKFDYRRDGPFLILRQVSPTSYEIGHAHNKQPLGVYHVGALCHYHGPDLQPVVGIRKRGRPPKKRGSVVPSRDHSGPRGGECNERIPLKPLASVTPAAPDQIANDGEDSAAGKREKAVGNQSSSRPRRRPARFLT
ncbi:hypothetical protein NQ318_004409 [Aromia moschata]|uniref:Uncharacterized protein n=1 Tax=Aromia moschata TaxID=1265417 RepID=A0AAV8Y787_9CUCU|nr:hypothetical protein NQ318_004409 [Aromia moschata]